MNRDERDRLIDECFRLESEYRRNEYDVTDHHDDEVGRKIVGALCREILAADLAGVGNLEEAVEQMAFAAIRAFHRKTTAYGLQQGNRLGHGRHP